MRIHHIGGADLADLRIVDIFRQKAKADLRNRCSRIPSRVCDSDRHEGLLVAEKNRRVSDALGDGLCKSHVAGEIGSAAERHRVARQPELLAAKPVELEDLIDGRDLIQQFGVIGAALFDGDDTGARDPADLTFQIRDRLFDPMRGRVGFF